jgi:hypothetical protein
MRLPASWFAPAVLLLALCALPFALFAAGKVDKQAGGLWREDDESAANTALAAHASATDVHGLSGKLDAPATPSGYAVLYYNGSAWATKAETTLAVDVSSVTGLADALSAKATTASVTAVGARATNLEVNLGILAAQTVATAMRFYGGYSDPFTSDSLATKTGAYYNASTDLYDTQTPGDTDKTAGRTPTGSSEHGSYPWTNAVDDDTGTFGSCSATGSPSTLTVDLGSAFVLSAYTMLARSGDAGGAPTAWTFQGSNNGTDWTTLDTRTGQNIATKQTYSLSNTTGYRYCRWSVSALSNEAYTMQMAEVEVFGGVTQDITLVSGKWPMAYEASSGLWLALVQFVDTPTLGTDIKAYLSFDDATYTQVTLVDAGLVLGGTYHVLYAEGVPGGTYTDGVYWKATTHNTKALRFKWAGFAGQEE